LTRINLIPAEVIKTKKKKYSNLILLLVVVLNFLIIFSCLIMVVAQKASIKSAIELQTAENNEIENFIERFNYYDKEKKELLVRTNILKEIGSNRINWSEVLQDISMRVPSNIELTSIQGDSSIFDPENREKIMDEKFISPEAIIISGNAVSYLDISNFLIGLNLIPEIENGTFAASNTVVQDQNVVAFTIRLWWRNEVIIPELAQIKNENQNKEEVQSTQEVEDTVEDAIQDELQQEVPGG